MYGGYGGRYAAELASDMWIERNIPGGLNSPTGLALDLMMGGNPNPTYGQRWLGSFGGYESFGGPGGYGGFRGYY